MSLRAPDRVPCGEVMVRRVAAIGLLVAVVGTLLSVPCRRSGPAAPVLTRSTGRLPLRDHPISLVWIGVSLWLGSILLELALTALLPAGAYSAVLTGINVAFLVRAVGGTVIGLWLTGLLVDRWTAPDRLATSARSTT